MNDSVDPSSGGLSTSSRPPWSPRGSHIVVNVLLILAFGGALDTVLIDRLAILPLSAHVVTIGLIVMIVVFVAVPWWAALAQQRPVPKLPPIVPMEHSTAFRRLYRRFGWAPLVPLIALGVARELGVRLNGLSAAGDVVMTIAVVLAPLAYIYWSGDRYR